MAITKSGGKYFTDQERVWEEAYQTGLPPFRIGQWPGAFRLPDHPTPADLKPLFAGAGLPRVQRNRIGCFDITFTASKSVSVLLYALTPPHEWAASAAVIAKASVAQVEPLLARLTVNEGAQGKTKVLAQGVAVGFGHFMSYPGAPHAHFHAAEPNVAVTSSGKAGSIANANLLYTEHGASLAGSHKGLDDHFQLAGYRTVRKGNAVEIDGLPAGLIAELSPSRAAINEAQRLGGFSGHKAGDFYARQARRTVPKGAAMSPRKRHAAWAAVTAKYGVTRESLRAGAGTPLIANGLVRKYLAFCTARDALETCEKLYGTFTAAQYREQVRLMGIGRPTTLADLDAEAGRVLDRPKAAGVRRDGPEAGAETRYSTRAGAARRAAAERAYAADAFGDLKAEAGKLAKAVLVKTAGAAKKALAAIRETLDPEPQVVRLDARNADAFLAAHTRTGYVKAHAKALLRGLFAAGNPHDRAGVAEREFARLRTCARLPERAVVVVDRAALLSARQLDRLAKLAKRDGASVVLAGVEPRRPRRDPFGHDQTHRRHHERRV